MEIYLLTDTAVPTTEAWQAAVDALGFDVRFLNERPLPTGGVRLQTKCKSKLALLEIEEISFPRLRNIFPDVAFPGQLSRVHALYWSKTLEGGLAAYQATAAYLAVAKGLMIDTEEGILRAPDSAIELARKMAKEMPMVEAVMAGALAKMAIKPSN